MSSHYIKCHYITLNVITLHEITYIQANIAAYHFATGINLAPPLFPWGRAQSKELLPGQLAAGNDNGTYDLSTCSASADDDDQL